MLFLAYLHFCDATDQLGEVWKLWQESWWGHPYYCSISTSW
jgi:hypothetical protein